MALLITETEFESVQPEIVEGKEGQPKQLYLQGVFLQGECKNRNGRIYPEATLDREAKRYISECIDTRRALGELNHPPTPQVNPERASHLTVEMIKDGTNWNGKAKVLNTPMGAIVTGLIEGGAQIGVSSRGLGTLKEGSNGKIVQPDYFLSTIDIVSDPSAQSAWSEGIYEGAEWAVPDEARRFEIMKEIDKSVRENKKIDDLLVGEQRPRGRKRLRELGQRIVLPSDLEGGQEVLDRVILFKERYPGVKLVYGHDLKTH